MISDVDNKYTRFCNFLLTESCKGYQDYKAGSSLLFLFPYYSQVGLAQILNTLESIVAEDFKLSEYKVLDPIEFLKLSYYLEDRDLPPITTTLLNPSLNIIEYNKRFNFNLPNNVFIKNTLINFNNIGVMGFDSIYNTQDTLLPRERLTNFFKLIGYSIDDLDSYIDIAVNNKRIDAAAIFCEYYGYSNQVTQRLINKVELWNLKN